MEKMVTSEVFCNFFFILNKESCQPNIQSIWDQIGQAFN